LLVAFQRLQLVFGILVVWIEFHRLAIAFDGQLLLAVLFRCFGKAVVDIPRFRVLLSIELEYDYSVRRAFRSNSI
jgi:hypothetical protein